MIVYEPGSKIEDNKIKLEKELSSVPKMIGFGEIALLMNSKRTASIIASEGGCETWVLSADVFKHIIAANTMKRRSVNVAYLDRVGLFKHVEINDKLKLIDGLVTPSFKQGDFIFHEGDVGAEFYIIEQGECECLKVDPEAQGGFV